YSATDADSEGEEGVFFIWTPDELRAALDPQHFDLAIDVWGVTKAGNFEGKNILYLPQTLDSVAAANEMSLDELLERVDGIRETLWQAREQREHPIRDDKVVTAWNGMMITAFAEGAEILGEDRYLEGARRAAEFLWTKNRRDAGSLWRVHLDGSSSIPALQDDYAYFAESLVALYDVSGEERWLERAREVADAMLERFWDPDDGGFFMNAKGSDPHLIGYPKSPSDGAVPSGNSVAARVLARLGDRTGEALYRDRANATVSAFAGSLEQRPSGFGYMLTGLDELLHGGAGPRQYGADGTVKAVATLTPAGDGFELAVDLEIRDGWHVNAHRPLQEELIPTVLTVDQGRGDWRLGTVEYPDGEKVRLSFQDEPLLVYHGKERLTARLEGNTDGSGSVVPVRLRIQACNDRVCLRPEELVLEVPAAGG
ncbi:MAG: protein-disulfide reductase DsbD domain-containing protein, partial [Thermoanaerobaculia bacterium]